MNSYYLTLILKPDLEEKDKKDLLSQISGKFGRLLKEEAWGGRDLAYPIKKQTKGWYAHFEFESDPKTILELDKDLKLKDDVLRYLLIRNR